LRCGRFGGSIPSELKIHRCWQCCRAVIVVPSQNRLMHHAGQMQWKSSACRSSFQRSRHRLRVVVLVQAILKSIRAACDVVCWQRF
jgi:hypothetical protein